jgi:hypothetical protein
MVSLRLVSDFIIANSCSVRCKWILIECYTYLMCASEIVDSNYYWYPVFNKILSTCHQQCSRNEYNTVVDTFEHLLRIMDEEGHIPEDYFDLCGIKIDKDIHSKDVVRAATTTQESYQRSKCLTHSRKVNMRLEHLQIIKTKEIEKEETANLEHMELVASNSKVVRILCNKLKQDNVIGVNQCGEEYVNLCMMKMFSELTNPQLELFILARDGDFTSKSQFPAKGKLKDSEDNTVRNCIRIAFDCRTKSNRIERTLPFDLSDISDNNNKGNNWSTSSHLQMRIQCCH